MRASELSSLLLDLQHFDVRFKDTIIVVRHDVVFDVAAVIIIPGGSIPRDADYIDQLKFFLRRRVDSKRWYIMADGPCSPRIVLCL